MNSNLPEVADQQSHPSPVPKPQALAWHEGALWTGARDTRHLCRIDTSPWKSENVGIAPGIPWAAVSTGAELIFTLGEGPNDDRYLRRFQSKRGFDEGYRVAQPDFTGSYLSYDGSKLFLSQWYLHRILCLDLDGVVHRTLPIDAEISGHTIVKGQLFVLRGTEQQGESWSVARVDLETDSVVVHDLARVPFACRSLAFDGSRFWSSHREADKIVSFTLPPP